MSFFKDFREDLSKAVNELLPNDEADQEDTQEQIVNTLDTDDADLKDESENEKMKEWLEEFAQDDDNSEDFFSQVELSEDELTDDNFMTQKNNRIDDSIKKDSYEEDSSEDDSSEEDSSEEDSLKEDSSDQDSRVEDSVEEDDLVEDNLDDDNDLKEIIEEYKEEEEMNMDDNIDMDLLDALNADEEAEKTEQNIEKPVSKLRATSLVTDDDVTIITKGTTINGSISSDGSLDIMGNITGDVECLGKLSITGKIVGNSTAAEVYVNTERMEGSINSEGSVKVGLGTVIIGDITATSGVIAGAVKGEIDVNGPIVIDSTAIIKGNIKAKSVQINNGAVIEGFCSLSYAAVDVDNIFE